jgi:hypothetical protein
MVKEILLVVAVIIMVAIMVNAFERIGASQIKKPLKICLYIITVCIPPLGYLLVRKMTSAKH